MLGARFGLLFSIGFFLLFLNACAYTQSSLGPDNVPHERPDPQDKFCIMLPPDIAHGSKIYFSEGKTDPESTVAYRLFTTLNAKCPSVILVETSNEEQAIKRCSSRGAKYLFSPLIRQWQGRASQFSFMRNIAEIEIRLIKVESRELVRSVIFEARSGWFNAGWDDPAGLLKTDSLKQSINDLID